MSNELSRRAFVCRLVLLECWAALFWLTCGSPSAGESTTHVVQKGDTVWAVARRYGVKPEEIVAANQLDQPDAIFPGKVLVIPRASTSSQATTPVGDGGGKHIVQKGESLWAIARMHGVSLEAIINANGLKKPYLIHPGQELLIPGSLGSQARRQEIASLCRLPRGVRPRKWRYIIIHHSGTSVGNAAVFDRSHRRRRMENGLAYHFVIGNGKGAADGEIEVGGRWTKQLQGGHVRSRRMNEMAIGICLVGNFDKTHPTKKQMDSLARLVKYLMGKYNVPEKRVVGHGDVQGTDCPGKNLSVSRFKEGL